MIDSPFAVPPRKSRWGLRVLVLLLLVGGAGGALAVLRPDLTAEITLQLGRQMASLRQDAAGWWARGATVLETPPAPLPSASAAPRGPEIVPIPAPEVAAGGAPRDRAAADRPRTKTAASAPRKLVAAVDAPASSLGRPASAAPPRPSAAYEDPFDGQAARNSESPARAVAGDDPFERPAASAQKSAARAKVADGADPFDGPAAPARKSETRPKVAAGDDPFEGQAGAPPKSEPRTKAAREPEPSAKRETAAEAAPKQEPARSGPVDPLDELMQAALRKSGR